MVLPGTRGTWDYSFYGTFSDLSVYVATSCPLFPFFILHFSDPLYSVCPSDSVYDCSLQVARSEFPLHYFSLPSHPSSDSHSHSLYLLCMLRGVAIRDWFNGLFVRDVASIVELVYLEEGEWLPKVSREPRLTPSFLHRPGNVRMRRHKSNVFDAGLNLVTLS